jgi:NADH:ubiquinone oxidoreductase subunit F (NADH-binding)
MEFDPSVEILPPLVRTKIGDRNKGLKIISVEKEGRLLKVNMEGLADEFYELGVMNEELIDKVEGATLDGNKLKIEIPPGKNQAFLPHQILIYVRNTD